MLWSVALWVLQGLLAAQFLFHGLLFVAPPVEMVDQMNAMLAPGFRMFIGVTEILAAIGVILPSVTRVLPWLTPLAAAGLMIVTGSATVFHVARGEPGNAMYTAVLLLLVTLLAYVRWRVRPIAARGEHRRRGRVIESGGASDS
ncbi:MAG: DoxX family protein [Chloroflexi bacterium]|nr:DoxX family protein [Chloroflexota bacterium]